MFSDPTVGAMWITTIALVVLLYLWMVGQREWKLAHWQCRYCPHGKHEHLYGQSRYAETWPQDPVQCSKCACRAYSPKA